MTSYLGRHRAPRTDRSQTLTRMAGTTAMVVSLGGAMPAMAAEGGVSDSRVTVTDGCGRADGLTIEGSSREYRIWFPGLTMDAPGFTPPDKTPNAKAPKVPAYEIVWGDSWVRSSDAIDAASKKGLAIRVTDDDNRYVPITDASGRVGTESFLFTNEDCATPLEPTFTDEDGTANDAVTIPSVVGVKYSGKPGTTAGKGTVRITATPDKGYRLADSDGNPLSLADTTWSHTFASEASIEVPAGREPAFRRGAWVADTSGQKGPISASATSQQTSPSGRTRTPNVVILYPIDGVTWVIDGKPAATKAKGSSSKGAVPEPIEVEVGTRESVVVEAVSTNPAVWALSGNTTWELGVPSTATTVPVVTAPPAAAGLPLGRARVTWKVPFGVEGAFTYDVQVRTVTAKKDGRRVTPWKKWTDDTALTRGTLTGAPGGVYEVRARSIDAKGEVSGWSNPTLVLSPLDIRTGPRPAWRVGKAAGVAGNTLVTSTRKGATWTARTTFTDSITLWLGTGTKGGRAKIYVDGRHVAWAGTYDRAPKGGRMSVTIPVKWGAHTVKVVNDSSGRSTSVALDGIAYGR